MAAGVAVGPGVPAIVEDVQSMVDGTEMEAAA